MTLQRKFLESFRKTAQRLNMKVFHYPYHDGNIVHVAVCGTPELGKEYYVDFNSTNSLNRHMAQLRQMKVASSEQGFSLFMHVSGSQKDVPAPVVNRIIKRHIAKPVFGV